jgi:Cu2+-exporting ATPase
MPERSDLSPVVIAIDGSIAGVIGLGDPIGPEVESVLGLLRRNGWRTTLLSGDAPVVARAVGAQLGFDPENIHGAVTPEEKLEFVEQLMLDRSGAGPVVMVGDGVNDAAAIARADVGIAVSGGAEASLASADVFMSTPGLEPLARLVAGSTRTMRVVRRNIFWALGYNLVGVSLAMSGVLSPLLAAVLMPASSITVLMVSWLSRTFDATPITSGVVVDRNQLLRSAA